MSDPDLSLSPLVKRLCDRVHRLKMNAPEELRKVLKVDCPLRVAEEGIFSVLQHGAHAHLYDRRAAMYDFVVGTRLYNRLMWGNSPLDYAAFAHSAITSTPDGRLLDAPCGSLLFSARSYLATRRPIIALDQSLAMLRRARRRLIEEAGSLPAHVVLLQGDLSDLPFRPEAFPTILCMNVLHQFEEAATLIPQLKRLLTDEGQLFVTSLVKNRRLIGDLYLDMLYRAGEFIRPRSSVELRELLEKTLKQRLNYRTKGNMAYACTDTRIDLPI
jgi:ubiquinone/menaquinone biosynthesis C-methylase UbiE